MVIIGRENRKTKGIILHIFTSFGRANLSRNYSEIIAELLRNYCWTRDVASITTRRRCSIEYFRFGHESLLLRFIPWPIESERTIEPPTVSRSWIARFSQISTATRPKLTTPIHFRLARSFVSRLSSRSIAILERPLFVRRFETQRETRRVRARVCVCVCARACVWRMNASIPSATGSRTEQDRGMLRLREFGNEKRETRNEERGTRNEKWKTRNEKRERITITKHLFTGYKPDLPYLEAGGIGLGKLPNKPIDCKSNPIDVDDFTYEVIKAPRSGLYALGPLVGDNFVRYILGGAFGILVHTLRTSTTWSCPPIVAFTIHFSSFTFYRSRIRSWSWPRPSKKVILEVKISRNVNHFHLLTHFRVNSVRYLR